MALESLAEKTVRLIKFLGKHHGCEVKVNIITDNKVKKNIVRREISWSKATERYGVQTHTFFVYEGMKELGEYKEKLNEVQRKLDIVFG